MSRGWQGLVLRALGAKEHLITLVSKRFFTDHYVRLEFEAPTLFSDVEPRPAAWLRLWFPDPAGGRRQYQRGYTIAEADPEAGRLIMEFVLHEPAGPASAWALGTEAGDQLIAQSLGSVPFQAHAESDRLVLLADLAAVPAVNAVLRELPAERDVVLLLEQAHADDAGVPLTEHPRLRVHRFDREGPATMARQLAEQVPDLDGAQVWAAGESGSLKGIRKAASGRAGGSKANTHIQAYWIAGRAMGTARD
ncbi:siderophore-interacting protein [Rothia halotolerans]|uniref:siderophore-interacting protein n=1 Tax=Rothia halotolerans TaxID=405770 RepID=UPI0013EA2092|nr:siderophore-interacting protein [Rothia halotolerans]